uniref:Major facilitator superfamily (MFS) profile domain-containing protein n=1 Tax=Ditylenchus dipsaci TaxID=166011 RepID=A0A915EA56_9BILA
MAVVCMVNSTAVHSGQNSSLILSTQLEVDEQCPREINFESSKQKDIMVSYCGLQLCNHSYLAHISTVHSNYSFYAYLSARVIMGAGEGLVYPSIASVSSRWFPPQERSTMAGLYTMGNQLGAVFNLLISSRLCSVNLFGGWPLIFMFSPVPVYSAFINDQEKLYIQKATISQWSSEATLDNTSHHSKQLASGPLPWQKMITSLPVLAMLIGNASFTFTAIVMQSYLPTFFKKFYN